MLRFLRVRAWGYFIVKQTSALNSASLAFPCYPPSWGPHWTMQSKYLEALQQPLESPEPAASPSSPLSFVVLPLSSPKSVLRALPSSSPQQMTFSFLCLCSVHFWHQNLLLCLGRMWTHPSGVLAFLQMSWACRTSCCPFYCVS